MAVLKFDKEHGTELSNLLLKLKHSRSAMVGCNVGYEVVRVVTAQKPSLGSDLIDRNDFWNYLPWPDLFDLAALH